MWPFYFRTQHRECELLWGPCARLRRRYSRHSAGWNELDWNAGLPSAPPAVEGLSGCFRNLSKRSELIKMFLPILREESMLGAYAEQLMCTCAGGGHRSKNKKHICRKILKPEPLFIIHNMCHFSLFQINFKVTRP